jgi:hypothetical protein
MFRNQKDFDPVLIRRIRISLTIMQWLVLGMLLFLQQDLLISVIKIIF